MIAKCKFCDFQIIADRSFKTAEDAAEYATLHCNCADAIQYKEEKEEREKREKNIKRIHSAINSTAQYCKAKGVVFMEEPSAVFEKSAICVLDGFFDSISFKIGQIKITISKNSKGVLVFKKNYSETNLEEVVQG